MKLKNNIRILRFNHNELSQQDLADLVGVTRMTIYSIEKNKYTPSTLLAFKIARVFNKSIEDVFYIDNEGDEINE